MNVKELPIRDLLLVRCATWSAYEKLWYIDRKENIHLLREFQAAADEIDNRFGAIINNAIYDTDLKMIICNLVEEGVEISYRFPLREELYNFYVHHLEMSEGEVIL